MHAADLLIGLETPAECQANDALVNATLRKLFQAGWLPSPAVLDTVGYQRTQQRLTQTFRVERSSVTTRMARLLYGLSDALQPRAILGVGTAYGNALAWLTAPVNGRARVVGVDLDADATHTARSNFEAAQLQASWLVTDARALPALETDPYDLILIDADDAVTGKGICVELLQALRPLFAPNAVILAHDATYPKFAVDFDAYRQISRNPALFHGSVTIGIDRFGLEVTRR